MVVSFIGGENWSTRGKTPTCRKSWANFDHILLYRNTDRKTVIIRIQVYDVDIKLVHTTRFWNNLHHLRSRSKIGEPNKLKFFGSKKTKGSKHDSQHWLRYLWNLRILWLNKSTCRWLIIHDLHFEVNSYHMSASCIYSDYWLVNWSSKVIIQYHGADLDLKYFKWALYMEMLYMCFKIIGKSTIRPSLIKLFVFCVAFFLNGDWFMQRGQTPMFAREIIYTPYFYLQKRNHVGSINEFLSKTRLSLIDRMIKHKN